MLQGSFEFRLKSYTRSRLLFVVAIIIVRPLAVQSLDQGADAEARLRARISAYWEAMQKSDFETAALYVHPSSRNLFRHQVPKSRVIKWNIEKLAFNQEYTVCDTVIRVTKPFPMLAETIDWPLQNRWVLHDGEWYFKLPWEEGENPLLKIFGEQAEVKTIAPGLATDPIPAGKVEPPKPVEKQPRIVSDPSNPGSVRFGEKTVLKFQYTNYTQAPIKIVSVHSDCHCTGIKKDFPELAPGESGMLEVTLDTFGLPLGRLNKEILIQFSDLQEPTVMTFSVENVPNFAVLPGVVDFGTVKTGSPAGRTARIINRSGRTVTIISINRADPKLEFSLAKTSFNAGEEMRLALRYSPEAPGEIFDNLQLRTDLAAEPIINVPIRGRVAP